MHLVLTTSLIDGEKMHLAHNRSKTNHNKIQSDISLSREQKLFECLHIANLLDRRETYLEKIQILERFHIIFEGEMIRFHILLQV